MSAVRKPQPRKPKGTTAAVTDHPQCISRGSGMTAGLEIWRVGAALHLYDRSPDGRFASDIATWATATGGLNATTLQFIKDAGAPSSNERTVENAASARTSHSRT